MLYKDPYPYFECLNTLNGHLGEVTFVAFGSNDQTLVSGSLKTIKIWNLATGEEIRTLEDHSERVSSVAISTDGQTLVSGSWDKTIKVWGLP